MKPENFEALLAYLCPEDREKAGSRYLVLQAKVAGFLRLKGMSDPEADADEVLDRAGEKIRNGYNIPDINKFCIGIAKNIIHERLRDQKRMQTAAQQFTDSMQDKSTEAEVEEIMNRMKPCFEKLPAEDQYLLIEYCKVPPGPDCAEHRRRLAKRLNSNIAALRIRVARLRRRLEKCLDDSRNKR